MRLGRHWLTRADKAAQRARGDEESNMATEQTVSAGGCEVVELDSEHGLELFDQTARSYMGISGAQFLELWDSGKFDGVDWDDVQGLAQVAIALPFAGR